MKKKKTTSHIQNYWETKLGINYDTELQRYKKLCGIPDKIKHFSKKNINDVKCDILLYSEWKKHILSQIECVDIELLKEYSRYLNQEYRNKNNKESLIQSIFTPLIFCIVAISLNPLTTIFDLNSHGGIYEYIFFIFMLIIVFGTILYKRLSRAINLIDKYFYQDMKEIVDEYINNFDED